SSAAASRPTTAPATCRRNASSRAPSRLPARGASAPTCCCCGTAASCAGALVRSARCARWRGAAASTRRVCAGKLHGSCTADRSDRRLVADVELDLAIEAQLTLHHCPRADDDARLARLDAEPAVGLLDVDAALDVRGAADVDVAAHGAQPTGDVRGVEHDVAIDVLELAADVGPGVHVHGAV